MFKSNSLTIMTSKNIVLIGAAIWLFATGCATKPVALSPVGPEPTGHMAADSKGYLEVFSATQKSPAIASDDNTTFNLHSGYVIEDTSGQISQYVPNHASNMDEWPDRVALPPGTYQILVDSAGCGQVSLSAVIEPGKITVVHLDRNWSPPFNTSSNQLVYLPDGEAVGWNVSSSQSND